MLWANDSPAFPPADKDKNAPRYRLNFQLLLVVEIYAEMNSEQLITESLDTTILLQLLLHNPDAQDDLPYTKQDRQQLLL